MPAQKATTFQPKTNFPTRVPSRTETGKVLSPVATRFTITKFLNTKTSYSFNDRDENLPIILARRSERYHFIE